MRTGACPAFASELVAPALSESPVGAQEARYDAFANASFTQSFFAKDTIPTLKNELIFERAVQGYLWAAPALNVYGMKEGLEKVFGKGYNVLPIFKDRLNAKTLITTSNSDVTYALGKEASAKPMQLPNASATPTNMPYPTDGTAFDMLNRLSSTNT
jgi:hypothetical protein